MIDMDFEKLKDVPGIDFVDVNTTTTCEHGGEIERSIWILKERTRCVTKTLYVARINKLHK